MIDRIATIGTVLVAALLTAGGCGGPTAPPPGSQPLGSEPVRETSSEPSEEATAEAPGEPSPQDEAAQDEASPAVENTDANSPATAGFTPPYPERSELFQPPRVEQVARPASGEEDSGSGDIRLLGFIGSSPRRAVLSYNGQVETLNEGSEIGGVELVDMSGTQVTLRRGRVQWTLSLLAD